MSIQLPLKLNLESHSRLDDYVGEAAGRLQKLDQLTIVFGEKGSGKSHLLQGLCRQTIESGGYAFFVPLSVSLKSEILKNLEEALLQLNVPTGVGPSGTPINAPALTAVQTKLKALLV